MSVQLLNNISENMTNIDLINFIEHGKTDHDEDKTRHKVNITGKHVQKVENNTLHNKNNLDNKKIITASMDKKYKKISTNTRAKSFSNKLPKKKNNKDLNSNVDDIMSDLRDLVREP